MSRYLFISIISDAKHVPYVFHYKSISYNCFSSLYITTNIHLGNSLLIQHSYCILHGKYRSRSAVERYFLNAYGCLSHDRWINRPSFHKKRFLARRKKDLRSRHGACGLVRKLPYLIISSAIAVHPFRHCGKVFP